MRVMLPVGTGYGVGVRVMVGVRVCVAVGAGVNVLVGVKAGNPATGKGALVRVGEGSIVGVGDWATAVMGSSAKTVGIGMDSERDGVVHAAKPIVTQTHVIMWSH